MNSTVVRAAILAAALTIATLLLMSRTAAFVIGGE